MIYPRNLLIVCCIIITHTSCHVDLDRDEGQLYLIPNTHETYNFSDARSCCQKNGGYLPSYLTHGQKKIVRDVMNQHETATGVTLGVWLDGYVGNSSTYVNASNGLPVEETDWMKSDGYPKPCHNCALVLFGWLVQLTNYPTWTAQRVLCMIAIKSETSLAQLFAKETKKTCQLPEADMQAINQSLKLYASHVSLWSSMRANDENGLEARTSTHTVTQCPACPDILLNSSDKRYSVAKTAMHATCLVLLISLFVLSYCFRKHLMIIRDLLISVKQHQMYIWHNFPPAHHYINADTFSTDGNVYARTHFSAEHEHL